MSTIEIIKKFEDFKAKILQFKKEFEKENSSKLLIFSNDGVWDIVMIKNVGINSH